MIDLLRDALPVRGGALREGLLTVELPGRFQVLPGRPTVVLDVAHNPHAAGVLADELGAMGFFASTIAVFGMFADKDIAGVAAAMNPRVDRWFVAPLPGPRGRGRRCAARNAVGGRRRGERSPGLSGYCLGVRRGAGHGGRG